MGHANRICNWTAGLEQVARERGVSLKDMEEGTVDALKAELKARRDAGIRNGTMIDLGRRRVHGKMPLVGDPDQGTGAILMNGRPRSVAGGVKALRDRAKQAASVCGLLRRHGINGAVHSAGVDDGLLVELGGVESHAHLRAATDAVRRRAAGFDVASFHTDADGPDALYDVVFTDRSPAEARAFMAEHGIDHSVAVRHGRGARIVAIDPGVHSFLGLERAVVANGGKVRIARRGTSYLPWEAGGRSTGSSQMALLADRTRGLKVPGAAYILMIPKAGSPDRRQPKNRD